jgi:hypothetical protein
MFVIALVGLSFVAAPISQARTPAPLPVHLASMDPGPGGFMSPNIHYVATIPIESPGVSARVVQLGAQTRLYVSSAKGLAVYDVTNPALPLLLGRLDTHNWENEDVAVSADGATVLMSDFEGVAYLIVISVTTLPGGAVAITPVGVSAPGGNHTIECVDDPCNWAYGSSGNIYDLHDKTKPTVVGDWLTGRGVQGGHHVTRDDTGLMWTDTTPILALNPWPDPVHPTVVATSDKANMSSKKTAYQHNNIRPFAALYQPRVTTADLADPNLRPGEILLSEGETNLRTSCSTDNGPFATYDLRRYDSPGTKFKLLDVFRPIQGNYQDGNPAVNALGCSGHWFSVRPSSTPDKIVTANGWYEHGTRVFGVDGKTGKITQLGFFQPVVGSASAAYWVGNNYIYVVDYERGIDILRYDDTAPTATPAQFRASWLAKLHVVDPFAAHERWLCRVAASGRKS